MSKISTLVAMVATLATNTDASIYQETGIGLCQPSSGTFYSYILKPDFEVASHSECATSCDNVAGATQKYYRGFSHVRNANIAGIPNHSCLCFYDYHHLPGEQELAVDWSDWELHDDGDGEGVVSTSDGTEGVGCYELLIAESVSMFYYLYDGKCANHLLTTPTSFVLTCYRFPQKEIFLI